MERSRDRSELRLRIAPLPSKEWTDRLLLARVRCTCEEDCRWGESMVKELWQAMSSAPEEVTQSRRLEVQGSRTII